MSANGLSLGITGSASKVGGAFSTSFKRYRLRSGRNVFANTSAPALVPGLAGRVQGVFGLDTLPQMHPQGLGQAGASGADVEQATDPSTRTRHVQRCGEQ